MGCNIISVGQGTEFSRPDIVLSLEASPFFWLNLYYTKFCDPKVVKKLYPHIWFEGFYEDNCFNISVPSLLNLPSFNQKYKFEGK